jgi:hypothetical protein
MELSFKSTSNYAMGALTLLPEELMASDVSTSKKNLDTAS